MTRSAIDGGRRGRGRAVRGAGLAGFALALGAAFLIVAPVGLGGSVAYVNVWGVSMQPRFHTGDLAMIRPASDYRVGEIVAYRSATLRTTVMHRIVALDGNRYVMKGDHNTFLDPDRPTRGQVIGRLWARVPHGGRLLQWVHQPLHGTLLVLALVLLSAGGEHSRRRWLRRDAPRTAASSRLRIPDSVVLGVCASGAVTAVAALLAAALPAQRPTATPLRYRHELTVGYAASVRPSALYPEGRVATGEPVYLRQVTSLRVSAGYRLVSALPHDVHGRLTLTAVLSAPSGWTRTVATGSAVALTADAGTTGLTLDLPALLHTAQGLDALTGVPSAGYTLTLRPRISVAGTLDGARLRDTYAPAVPIAVTSLQLQFPTGAAPGRPGSPGVQALSTSLDAAVTVSRPSATVFPLLGHRIPLAPLRSAAYAALMLADLLMLVLGTILAAPAWRAAAAARRAAVAAAVPPRPPAATTEPFPMEPVAPEPVAPEPVAPEPVALEPPPVQQAAAPPAPPADPAPVLRLPRPARPAPSRPLPDRPRVALVGPVSFEGLSAVEGAIVLDTLVHHRTRVS